MTTTKAQVELIALGCCALTLTLSMVFLCYYDYSYHYDDIHNSNFRLWIHMIIWQVVDILWITAGVWRAKRAGKSQPLVTDRDYWRLQAMLKGLRTSLAIVLCWALSGTFGRMDQSTMFYFVPMLAFGWSALEGSAMLSYNNYKQVPKDQRT